MEVKVFDNDVDKALKVLKNKLSKNGLFKELKLRRAYEKPSVKTQEKSARGETAACQDPETASHVIGRMDTFSQTTFTGDGGRNLTEGFLPRSLYCV